MKFGSIFSSMYLCVCVVCTWGGEVKEKDIELKMKRNKKMHTMLHQIFWPHDDFMCEYVHSMITLVET